MTETPNPQKDYAEDISGEEPWWAILILFTTILVIIGLITVVSWFVPDEPKDTSCVQSSEYWAGVSLERHNLNLERAKLVCEKKGGEFNTLNPLIRCDSKGKTFEWNGDQFTREEVEVLK